MRLIATDVQRGRCVWGCAMCVSVEPYKSGRTNRNAVWVVASGWSNEACIRRLPDPAEKGQIWQHLQAHYEVQEYPA